MHKQVRKLVKEIEDNGFSVAKAGRGGHAKVYNAQGGTVAVLPISPMRGGRWEANLRAELRRKGILPRQGEESPFGGIRRRFLVRYTCNTSSRAAAWPCHAARKGLGC